jgi:hypothetical protein
MSKIKQFFEEEYADFLRIRLKTHVIMMVVGLSLGVFLGACIAIFFRK